MITCGTCKHWQTLTAMDEPPVGKYLDRTNPDVVAANAQYGQCGAMAEGPLPVTAPIQTPLAVVKDYENYGANLFTKATFGCVLGEQADTDLTPAPAASLKDRSIGDIAAGMLRAGRALDEEMIGRRAFDAWRSSQAHVGYDWADMGEAEKQRWIARGKADGLS